MHNHICRFIDNQQIFIFVNDVERNGFRKNVALLRFGHGNAYLRPFRHTRLGIGLHRAVDRDCPVRQQPRKTRS